MSDYQLQIKQIVDYPRSNSVSLWKIFWNPFTLLAQILAERILNTTHAASKEAPR